MHAQFPYPPFNGARQGRFIFSRAMGEHGYGTTDMALIWHRIFLFAVDRDAVVFIGYMFSCVCIQLGHD